MIEEIRKNGKIFGIIVSSQFHKEGVAFFTPDTFSQQLGYMNRPSGYRIDPHIHNVIERKVELTQEVLFIKTGKVRVDFYDDDRSYVESRLLSSGDIVLLAHGGHGFEIVEKAEIIEVKQGPYCGEQDKIRFNSVLREQVRMRDGE